jgi:glycosyltransferase involved in cell wall biosynthesis
MSANKFILSIVVPVYNEEENIHILVDRLNLFRSGIQPNTVIEIILVDDHSSDKTPQLLKEVSLKYDYIKSIRLSKNSGSHVAILAGLSIAKGDCAVFLAGDLQDPPELIDKMLAKWREGNQIVWAVRGRRDGISVFERAFSKVFYFLFNKLSAVKYPPSGADFALLDRKVYINLLKSSGTKPSLGGLIAWLGYQSAAIEYVKEARRYGKSKWTLSKKINAFSDAFVSFSYVPLRLMSFTGITVAIVGFLYAMLVILIRLLSSTQIPGWTSLMIVVLIMGGTQMLMIGVIGEYLWRTLEESRKRPLFFIEDASDPELLQNERII